LGVPPRYPIRPPPPSPNAVPVVYHSEVNSHPDAAMLLAGADVVLLAEEHLEHWRDRLPGDLLPLVRATAATPVNAAQRFAGSDVLPLLPAGLSQSFANRACHHAASVGDPELVPTVRRQQRVSEEKSWAGEVAWRLLRHYELSTSRRPPAYLDEQLRLLEPRAADVAEDVQALRQVAVPSFLQCIQSGYRVRVRGERASFLTAGLPNDVRATRHVLLQFQHRMHPAIADFPRLRFYGEVGALQDANSVLARSKPGADPWVYSLVDGRKAYPARRVWVTTPDKPLDEHFANEAEAEELVEHLRRFVTWAADHPRPDGEPWEVACLAFYQSQERRIREKLQRYCTSKAHSRFERRNVDIVNATVDRFQGHEADLVLLSFRNTDRVGFLDSPNRLNVAITRARHMLVLVGHRDYFLRRCRVPELRELAQRSWAMPPFTGARREGKS
jgi:hypothetical protein